MASGNVRIVFNELELYRVTRSTTGPVGRMLAGKGEIVAAGMWRRAPVSKDGSHGRPSGYMRSKIKWTIDRDVIGLYVDIGTDARTPEGAPYPIFVEVGTREHFIRPRSITGKLVFWHSGKLQFRDEVLHPGTAPQPFMRPALDDIRGA